MSVRHFLQSHWSSIAIVVTAAAIACAFLVIWLSMPPRVIVMATGPEGGTYFSSESAIARRSPVLALKFD